MPYAGRHISIPARRSELKQEWKIAKQFISDFDLLSGDVKEFVRTYIYYVTRRPKNDVLEIGRTSGGFTSMKDKRKIEAVYDNKCVMCGTKGHLQIHHIEKLCDTQNRDIENQIPVCKECHCKIHGKV